MALGNIPGILLLLGATILLVLASVTVPVTDRFYFLQAHISGISVAGVDGGAATLRLGMWGACLRDQVGKQCTKTALGYNLNLDFLNLNDDSRFAQSLLRGVSKALILIPISAAVSFVAFLFALSTFFFLDVLASLISLPAAFITAIAFIVSSVVFIVADHRLSDIDGVSASLHNAYWFVLAALIAQLLASVFVLFGCVKRRRARRTTGYYPEGSAPPMRQQWWNRKPATLANGTTV